MNWQDWDKALLALTLYREARGEGVDGMRAVAHVVRNRVSAGSGDWGKVMSAKWQFSSLTAPGDGQLVVWPTKPNPVFETCMDIAEKVYDGVDDDLTQGATHYFADTIQPPAWAAALQQTVKIGHHTFFK